MILTTSHIEILHPVFTDELETMMQEKICFTQKELARRWTLSHRTLERWRSVGTGPAFMRIGGRIIYRLEDVVTYERDQLCLCTRTLRARVA